MVRLPDLSMPLTRFAVHTTFRRASQAPLVDVIEGDHRQLLWLLDAIVAYAEGDEERLDLFDQLRRDLLAHLRAEESVAYPAMAHVDAARVACSLAEHQAFEAALVRLAETPPGDDWGDQLAALRRALLHHMQEERTTLFPQVRQTASIADQVALGGAFEAARNARIHELRAR